MEVKKFNGRINERILRNTWKIFDESYQGQFGSGPGRDHGKPGGPTGGKPVKPDIKPDHVQADNLELPETLLNRLSLAEEEIEGFDKDDFVARVVRDRLKELEENHGKVVAWNIQPFYYNDEGLKDSS